MSEEMFKRLAKAVIDGDKNEGEKLAKKSLDQDLDPLECINKGLTARIIHVGKLFAAGEFYLPELIMGANVMKQALTILEPALLDTNQERIVLARVVIGTVKGDFHDIGKSLVGTMLSANGFAVKDIGIDKSPSEFIAAAIDFKADLVGLSALLTTTVPMQAKVVEAIDKAGLSEKTKVMVGGAPVTQKWADEIHADGYAKDAIAATALAKKLIGNQ